MLLCLHICDAFPPVPFPPPPAPRSPLPTRALTPQDAFLPVFPAAMPRAMGVLARAAPFHAPSAVQGGHVTAEQAAAIEKVQVGARGAWGVEDRQQMGGWGALTCGRGQAAAVRWWRRWCPADGLAWSSTGELPAMTRPSLWETVL